VSKKSVFRAAVMAVALVSAACTTTSGGGSTIGGPKGDLPLGETSAAESKLAADFAATVNARYTKGMPLNAATADLEKHKFNCGKPNSTGGDPPAQVCRRPMKANGCDHTWQVHLFTEAGQAAVSRARGLYDRACGADDLLGK
jgi:hypothetical protein